MECVLNDPKWGMWSMMYFMLHRGVGRECSHVFGRQFYLPVFIFFCAVVDVCSDCDP